MLADWLAALEAGAIATGLRNSLWAYPIVNAGHVLGIALLVGGALPLDLRLLGLWKSFPLRPLASLLGATAGVGLAMAISCGFLLFSARALSYAASPLFRAKILLLVLGLGVSLALRLLIRREGRNRGWARRAQSALAGASLLIWVAVLALGRFIGYF